MEINGHKVKRIKAINLDDIEGIKETDLNPVAMFEHIDEIEEVLTLNFLCGVIDKVEVSDGTKMTGEHLRHLSAYAATELLGKLGFNQEDAKEFIDGVENGENDLFNDLFDKYWKRFSDRVKSVRKHD